MNPLSVKATNYGPYANVSWEIPTGLTAIVAHNTLVEGADSNGAGKTKLLELVPLCLFGPTLSWDDYLTTGIEDTRCVVELTFEHGPSLYRIRRTYDAKGRGKTTLDFESALFSTREGYTDDMWNPLTRGDQKETQALINATIGLSEATFAHSVFAAQGARHFADPTLPPRERKAILTEALGLEVWDELLKACNADISEVKKAIEAIDQKVGVLEADVADKGTIESDLIVLRRQASEETEEIARCELAVGEVNERLQSLATAASTRSAAAARYASATTRLGEITMVLEKSKAASEALDGAHERLAILEPIAFQVEELTRQLADARLAHALSDQRVRERNEIVGRIAVEEIRHESISVKQAGFTARIAENVEQVTAKRTDPGVCDHCNQPLAGEALEAAIASLQRDYAALVAGSAELDAEAVATSATIASLKESLEAIVVPDESDVDLAGLADRHAKALGAQRECAGLNERIVFLIAERDAATLPDFTHRYGEAKQEIAAAEAELGSTNEPDNELLHLTKREAERAATDLTIARTNDRATTARVAVTEERLRNLASLAERAQEALAEKGRLVERLNVLSALSRSYGRDGIPALILEASAIPHIENEAQRVLSQMGMPFRVELVTQKENKTGGVRDTLDVVVHEPNGPRRYETYSGGERTRLELALRVALARLIAHRSSSACEMLALDEPSWLDATGMKQLAEVLRGLPEFRSIVLVSHDERLVEAFDQTVIVERDENGSRVVA